MELGEIIDRSAQFWRAHWKKMFGLFFGFSLAEYAVLKIVTFAVMRLSPLMRNGAQAAVAFRDHPGEAVAQLLGAGSAYAAMILVLLFTTLVETAAATRFAM